MLNIYKASAGSGKTYRLTLEYIKLLIGEKDSVTGKIKLVTKPKMNQSHILAITFTNKATEEMKARIVKELSLLADGKSGYMSELCKYFQTEEDNISYAAKVALYDVLFTFTYFNVSTIDSFFQQVLRTFAQDIERPDNFEVSLDDKYILTQAVNRIIDGVSQKDKNIKEWLRKYVYAQIDGGGRFNIFNRKSSIASDIVRSIGGLMDETYRIYSKAINDYLEDIDRIIKFNEEIKTLRDGILKKFTTAAEELQKSVKEENAEDFFKLQLTLEDMKSGLYNEKRTSKLDGIISDPESAFKKTTGKQKRPQGMPSEALKTQVAETFALYADNNVRKKLYTYKAILANIYTMGLLGVATQEMAKFCRENDIILISDTNDLLSKIIGTDTAPFIYEQMGFYLHHFLIDEFQDTSRMQWCNMLPLVIESLAHGYDNLIIGDEKQCIYRFRNSTPELLGHQAQDIVTDIYGAGAVKVFGDKIEENTNWRSAPTVIKFNNTIFYALGRLAELFGAENSYAHVIQDIPEKHKNMPGYVRIEFLSADKVEKTDDAQEMGENVKFDPSALKLKKDLKMLITEYGYKASDIAILVDKNKEAAKIAGIIDEIKEEAEDEALKNLQVKLNEALTLETSPAVRIIINSLRLLAKPAASDEDGKPADSIGSEQAMQQFSRLFELYVSQGITPDEAVLKAFDGSDTTDSLLNDDGTTIIDADNVGVTIDLIVSKLPEEIRKKENLYISALIDAVLDYSEHYEQDLRSFLEWWDDCGRFKPVSFPDGTDSITISTIHKSKGLEYKVVIIPYANWKFYESSTPSKPKREWLGMDYSKFPEISQDLIPPLMPIDMKADLENTFFSEKLKRNKIQQRIDQLNKTYVAFTRAQSILLVYIPEKTKSDPEDFNSVFNKLMDSYLKPEKFGLLGENLGEKEKSLIEQPRISQDNKLLELGELVHNEVEKAKQTDKDGISISTAKMPTYTSYDHKKKYTEYFQPIENEIFDPEEAREKGIFLHNVLSDIDTPDDLDWAFHKWQVAVGLDENHTEEWKRLLEEALTQKDVQKWFVGYDRKLNEQKVIIDGGKLLRPDRVVVTADGYTDIIDYKFGEEKTTYKRQVQQYVDVFRTLGFKKVRGYIWYFLSGEIVEVDNGKTAEQILYSK